MQKVNIFYLQFREENPLNKNDIIFFCGSRVSTFLHKFITDCTRNLCFLQEENIIRGIRANAEKEFIMRATNVTSVKTLNFIKNNNNLDELRLKYECAYNG